MIILTLFAVAMVWVNIRETHLRHAAEEQVRVYRSIAYAVEDKGITIDL